MDKLIRYAAYLVNLILLGVAVVVMLNGYGRDIMYAALLMAPPVISFLALITGPDLEELRLRRQVNKARLRQELADLTGGKAGKQEISPS